LSVLIYSPKNRAIHHILQVGRIRGFCAVKSDRPCNAVNRANSTDILHIPARVLVIQAARAGERRLIPDTVLPVYSRDRALKHLPTVIEIHSLNNELRIAITAIRGVLDQPKL
jgi:hypothetical protein